ncbi:hypothetical protein ACS3SW_15380 [Roseobacteraceae bacterium S113]
MQYQTQPSVLVVVTDGFETCGGNPCEMAKSLSSNSAGLQIHVVGFNLPNESVGYGARVIAQRGARCLAEETGGMYVLTETAEELVSALNMTLGCMLLVGRETEWSTLPG